VHSGRQLPRPPVPTPLPSGFEWANKRPSEDKGGAGRRGRQARRPPTLRTVRKRQPQKQEARTRPRPRCCELPEHSAVRPRQQGRQDHPRSTTREVAFPAPERPQQESQPPKVHRSNHKSADLAALASQRLLTCHPKGVYLEIAVSPLQMEGFTVRRSVIRLASRATVAGSFKTW